MGPKKCLIMATEQIARVTIERMGLDPEEWEPRYYTQGLLGGRWSVAVMVQPPGGWRDWHRDTADHYRTKSDTVVML